jgi:hypothetical protein
LIAPTALKTALLGRVTDAGAAGLDTVYGAGILSLGPLQVTAATCAPRPQVVVGTSVQGGGLVTTVTATGSNNSLLRLVFGTGDRTPTNALLSFPTGASSITGAGGYTAYTPFGSVQTTFNTNRQAAGAAVTVPLVAVDRCGTWSTFVGAGTSIVGF